MASRCPSWKPEWIAALYEESNAEDERRMRAHLADCDDCRGELNALQATRVAIRSGTPPVVAVPRVVLLEPGPRRGTAWVSFAAGLAAAAAVFGIGYGVGSAGDRRVDPTGPGAVHAAGSNRALPATQDPDLRLALSVLEQRLADLERAPRPELTAAQFHDELQKLEQEFDRGRAGDLEYVMRSMTAKDLRTAEWMDRTERVLTYLAARQDPRLSEH